MTLRYANLLLSCVAVLAAAKTLSAQVVDHRQVLDPLLTQETVAVAYVDLEALDFDALGQQLETTVALTDYEKSQLENPINLLREVIEPLRGGGAGFVYFVMGTGDASLTGGPLVVAPLPGQSADRVRRQVAGAFDELTRLEWRRSQSLLDLQLESRTSGEIPVLMIGSSTTLDRYPPPLADERSDLVDPLAELAESGAAVGVVISGGRDHRRVLREMWPRLPEPYTELTGDILADGIAYLSLAANLPPAYSGQIVLQADSEATARTFADLAGVGFSEAGRLVVTKSTTNEAFLPLAAVVGQVVQLLTPTVDENRLVIDLRHDDQRVAALAKLVPPNLVDAALERSRRNPRMNRFKQMALAMHNFHDTRDHFPTAAAIRDAEGQPLLSWRVLLLPYLEQSALFDQFHLDEPWDSPHNRQLIAKMPDIYYDPAHPRLGRAGKTTYQVPVGPETAFLPADETEFYETKYVVDGVHLGRGMMFRDITDGTSNTIMLVDTAPSEAVIWTKPDDWEVDLGDPHRGLRDEGIKNFVAAHCDGSAHVVPMDISAEQLRARLTRDGREVIEY